MNRRARSVEQPVLIDVDNVFTEDYLQSTNKFDRVHFLIVSDTVIPVMNYKSQQMQWQSTLKQILLTLFVG